MGRLAILPSAHTRVVSVRLDHVICCSGELSSRHVNSKDFPQEGYFIAEGCLSIDTIER